MYSIEYYYDNVKDDAKTVTWKAEFASQITTYPDKLIAGYVLSGTVGLPLTITSNPVNNLIKVYYKKSSDLSYTIKYKDTENNTLSWDVVVPNQTFGDEIIVTPGAIEWYVTPSVENVTITADSSANVVTFIYNKRTDLTYTIKYQNSVWTSISWDVVVENQTFGAEVTVIPWAIEWYNVPASTGFIIWVTNPDVVFVYTERNDLSYKIRYVDTNNHELSWDVVVNGQIFGDDVVVNAPEILWYNTPASTWFTIKDMLTNNSRGLPSSHFTPILKPILVNWPSTTCFCARFLTLQTPLIQKTSSYLRFIKVSDVGIWNTCTPRSPISKAN